MIVNKYNYAAIKQEATLTVFANLLYHADLHR